MRYSGEDDNEGEEGTERKEKCLHREIVVTLHVSVEKWDLVERKMPAQGNFIFFCLGVGSNSYIMSNLVQTTAHPTKPVFQHDAGRW